MNPDTFASDHDKDTGLGLAFPLKKNAGKLDKSTTIF